MNNAAKGPIAMIAAAVVAVIYLVAAWYLFEKFALPAQPEGNWERALSIFSGISTVGLAAIGVLIGTSIQQGNVANAQKQATEQKARTDRVEKPSRELVDKLSEFLAKHSQNFVDNQSRIEVEKALASLRTVLNDR